MTIRSPVSQEDKKNASVIQCDYIIIIDQIENLHPSVKTKMNTKRDMMKFRDMIRSLRPAGEGGATFQPPNRTESVRQDRLALLHGLADLCTHQPNANQRQQRLQRQPCAGHACAFTTTTLQPPSLPLMATAKGRRRPNTRRTSPSRSTTNDALESSQASTPPL